MYEDANYDVFVQFSIVLQILSKVIIWHDVNFNEKLMVLVNLLNGINISYFVYFWITWKIDGKSGNFDQTQIQLDYLINLN